MPKQTLLTGKVALVTGGARRIGAEIARTLHEAGMNVVLHYNLSEEEAVNLSDELNKKRDASAVCLKADLQEIDHIKALIDNTAKVWDRLDVLINNASKFYKTEIDKVTDYAWNDLINSNLKGPFFLAQHAAPYLSEKKGLILNITDIHGERPLKDFSVYCISKAALAMMTKVLAKELAPVVRVNAIAPGAILWPENQNALLAEEKEKIVKRTLLKQGGNPQDIAKAVLFFVRDANYITGQVLNIDGGRTLSG